MASGTAKLLVVFALFLKVTMCVSAVREVSAAANTSTCRATGFVLDKGRNCEGHGDDSCCAAGKRYPRFRCSPPVSAETPAVLTVNIFDNDEDGEVTRISSCDGRFYQNTELLVSMSSGWLHGAKKSRCNRMIRVSANGRSVLAKVVDECDSVGGCDEEHDFEPPCRNNVVGGSLAVWKALRLNTTIGEFNVTWSDA